MPSIVTLLTGTGIFLFKESVNIYWLVSIALIIIGVVGLKLFSEE